MASQIAKVTVTGTQMSAYTPSNSAAACPSSASDWNAVATPLPPTPNKELCSCMYQSLGCVVTSGTSTNDYTDLFSTVCGYGKACDGIAANGTTGTYGAYGMCNSTEQLAYAFNAYYVAQSSSASACAFSGAAATKAPQTAGGSCSSLLAEAGTAGTGTVTSQPTGTGAGSGSGSASGTSKSSASGSKAAGNMNTVPGAETGLLPMAIIVVLAAVSGMGMIAL